MASVSSSIHYIRSTREYHVKVNNVNYVTNCLIDAQHTLTQMQIEQNITPHRVSLQVVESPRGFF